VYLIIVFFQVQMSSPKSSGQKTGKGTVKIPISNEYEKIWLN